MNDKIFAEGFYFNKPHESAPDFVLGSVSIEPERFVKFLGAQQVNSKGYVRLSIKEGKTGKVYAEIDTYEKKEELPTVQLPSEKATEQYKEITDDSPNPDSIPF